MVIVNIMSHWAKYTVKPHSQNSISIINFSKVYVVTLGGYYLFLGGHACLMRYVPDSI